VHRGLKTRRTAQRAVSRQSGELRMRKPTLALIGTAMTLLFAPSCGSDSGTSSSGGSVKTCGQLCALAPVDSKTGDCVSAFVTEKGYDTNNPACANANTVSGCNGCYSVIHVTDADCAATHDACF